MRTLAKKALDLKVDLYAVETDEDGKKHESMMVRVYQTLNAILQYTKFMQQIKKDMKGA